MRIVFATRNEGKLREISQMLAGSGVELVSLNSFNNVPEIVEDGKTYLDNALKKAKIISGLTGETVLADDSGLQVDVLGGEPGVFSACYAGEKATDDENNAKLLKKLKGMKTEERKASFFCTLVLYEKDGSYTCFEAQWPGLIIDEPRGKNGFGYDPIFYIPGLGLTAAELTAEVKNKISHRGQAFAKLKQSLLNLK